MRFQGTKAFHREWAKLPADRQEKARQTLEDMDRFFHAGTKPEGLGLKKLRDPFWEIRTTLKDRILFTLEKDLMTFVLIGSHDDVHRFLRRG